jgi:hypothetical protein
LDHLSPREAHDVPSSQLELEVASAVAPADEPVHHRWWQTGVAHELEEAALELGAGRSRLVGQGGDQTAQRPDAAACGVCRRVTTPYWPAVMSAITTSGCLAGPRGGAAFRRGSPKIRATGGG